MTNTTESEQRKWSWLSFLVGVLVAAVLMGVPITFYVVQQGRQAAYTECLAEHGYYPGDHTIDTYEELEQLILDTEDC